MLIRLEQRYLQFYVVALKGFFVNVSEIILKFSCTFELSKPINYFFLSTDICTLSKNNIVHIFLLFLHKMVKIPKDSFQHSK